MKEREDIKRENGFILIALIIRWVDMSSYEYIEKWTVVEAKISSVSVVLEYDDDGYL